MSRHLLVSMLVLTAAARGQVLSPGGRIELPGVEGRIDHLSADVKGKRLFVSALGNNTVEVIDLVAGKRVHTLAGLAEPQGVYFDAAANRLWVACANDGTTKVFDATSFQLLSTVKFSADADNIRYDARREHVTVGYGDGALGFVDGKGKKTGEIPLEGHPESFQFEKAGIRAFVNVPDKKEIEVVDLAKSGVIAKWPVTSALKNFPMALDEAHHRLLIGCRAPARMLAIDTEGGRQTASVETVGDTDDLFYDAARGRVYVIGGQGFVDVFEQKSADGYERIGHYSTAPGARTGLFVSEWSQLFIAVPHRGEQRASVLILNVK
jgi:hypothetical protein